VNLFFPTLNRQRHTWLWAIAFAVLFFLPAQAQQLSVTSAEKIHRLSPETLRKRNKVELRRFAHELALASSRSLRHNLPVKLFPTLDDVRAICLQNSPVVLV
jgi:hypothetical protein